MIDPSPMTDVIGLIIIAFIIVQQYVIKDKPQKALEA